jgi:hypothetical protein
MPVTNESSGGHVEHEVHMLQGILLLTEGLKLENRSRKDNFAQVMASMVCTLSISTIR